MATVRRWYVYLVCFISLELAAWALIGLVSDLLLMSGIELVQAALLQVALLIVAVPVFGVHWFWAQRSAGREPDERASAIRQLYLYGTLAVLIGAGATHGYTLAATTFRLLLKEADPFLGYGPTLSETLVNDLTVLVTLLLLWLYHWYVVVGDTRAMPANDTQVTLRRLYLLGLSATGVTLTFWAPSICCAGCCTKLAVTPWRWVRSAQRPIALPVWSLACCFGCRIGCGPSACSLARTRPSAHRPCASFTCMRSFFRAPWAPLATRRSFWLGSSAAF